MKIYQSETQLKLKTSSLGQTVAGIIIIVIGVGLAVVVASGVVTVADGMVLPTWAALLGVAIVGGLLVGSSSNRRIILRKDGASNVSVKRIFGSSRSQDFETSSIVAVRLSTYLSTATSGIGKNSPNSQQRSKLSLILVDNSIVEIANEGNSGSVSGNNINVTRLILEAPLSKEASRIVAYLGVPLQTSDVSDPIAAIKAVVDEFRQPDIQPLDFAKELGTPTTPIQSPPSEVVVTTQSVVLPRASIIPIRQPLPPTEEAQPAQIQPL